MANRMLVLTEAIYVLKGQQSPREMGRLHPFVPTLLEDGRKVVPEGTGNSANRGKPTRSPERRLELTTGIIEHPEHATDLFVRKFAQSDHKHGELITGITNHQVGSHTHPSLLLPFDDFGLQYEGHKIKIGFSSTGEAAELGTIKSIVSGRPHEHADIELFGRTMLASVVFGPQDTNKNPFVLTFEAGRRFSEVENYVFERILSDQHMGATKAMIISAGMFSDVVLQKPEANVPVLERKPGPQKKKLEVATSALSQGLAPGITITDMRFTNGTSSYVTYGVFDCGAKTMRGKELLDKPFEGGNAIGMTIAGKDNIAIVLLS